MCAECHSTNVRQELRRRAETASQTTWSEIDVVVRGLPRPRLAARASGRRTRSAAHGSADPANGLTVDLAHGGGCVGVRRPAAHRAPRRAARHGREVETCARCHARRAQISERLRGRASRSRRRTSLALLDDGLYHADGQILDEVYEYGSFLQSRMHATRRHLHRLPRPAQRAAARRRQRRVRDAATCPRTYDTPAHHHHQAGTDGRALRLLPHAGAHLHGRRPPPRPQLPRAAPGPLRDARHAERLQRLPRRPPAAVGGRGGGEVVRPDAARSGRTTARRSPPAAAGRRDRARCCARSAIRPSPAIARATARRACSRASRRRSPAGVDARARTIADPLVRRPPPRACRRVDPSDRAGTRRAAARRSDAHRAARGGGRARRCSCRAALVSGDAARRARPRRSPSTARRRRFNADRAEARLNLGMLDARLGNAERRRGAPTSGPSACSRRSSPPYVNLADLYRAQGRDAEAERVLRQALAREPNAADVHHALGLLLVRQQRMARGARRAGAPPSCSRTSRATPTCTPSRSTASVSMRRR